jgi:hypothetical protein
MTITLVVINQLGLFSLADDRIFHRGVRSKRFDESVSMMYFR